VLVVVVLCVRSVRVAVVGDHGTASCSDVVLRRTKRGEERRGEERRAERTDTQGGTEGNGTAQEAKRRHSGNEAQRGESLFHRASS
jgi:hypothetical protein